MGTSRTDWRRRCEARVTLQVKRARAKSRKTRARNRRLQDERFRDAERQQTDSTGEASVHNACTLDATNFGMAVARDARELAFTVNALTSGKGLEYQRAVLERLLEEPLLQSTLPDTIVHHRELLQCKVVCNAIAEAWSELKYGVGKDHYLARNVIEAAVISVGDPRSIPAVAKCIGMNRRTLRRAMSRRRSLNEGISGVVWAKCDRKRRSDALSQESIDVVVQWWTEETRVSPQKKDVRQKRIGVNKFISHAGHWLEESQLDFYTRFKASTSLPVSFTSFKRLRPYFVKRLHDFNSCCCKYHMEMAEIIIGFNNMRSTKFHLGLDSGTCICGCNSVCCHVIDGGEIMGIVTCQASAHTYRRATHLWEESLCPRSGGEWHDLRCINGECLHCGFHLIRLCEQEFDPNNSKLLDWRRFEMVLAGKTKKGLPKQVLRLEYKQTTPRVFLDYAATKIPVFVRHQHTARWQDAQFKACVRNLQHGEIMSLIDYAENYAFKGQDEI